MKFAFSKNNKVPRAKSMKNNLVTLLTGNVLAQIILFLPSPILTRLFKPSDFGMYSAYTTLISIVLVVTSLSLEKAIPLEKENNLAHRLIELAFLFIFSICLLVLLIYFLFKVSVWDLIGVKSTAANIAMFSAGLLFASVTQVCTYINIRTENYRSTSLVKVVTNTGNVSSQLI